MGLGWKMLSAMKNARPILNTMNRKHGDGQNMYCHSCAIRRYSKYEEVILYFANFFTNISVLNFHEFRLCIHNSRCMDKHW